MALPILPLAFSLGFLPSTAPTPVAALRHDPTFDAAITRVESMVWEAEPQRLAQKHGLSLVNVTWEDTGRSKGSVWGPNISDMTIGVRDPSGALHPMPVFRFDNFNDKTADVKTGSIFLLTGNERGDGLEPVGLEQVLKDTRKFLHDPKSWTGTRTGLWDARDTHVLVSAQACFLPVPKSEKAIFTPVIYNYQSQPGNPAVLTIVATREGTSVQVIENDGGYMSEVLYFNADGQRAPFTATRLSDFRAQGGDATTPAGAIREDAGLNTVLVIQVPLKQKAPPRRMTMGYGGPVPSAAPMAELAASNKSSDVESAVIGHGEVEGPFTEIHNLDIERDPQFPVRVTVQFYKATSNGVVTDADIADLRRQIDRVYEQGDFVGSLVTGGLTPRPTEWVTKPTETAVWARPWWKAY